jgi:hypothetical protein
MALDQCQGGLGIELLFEDQQLALQHRLLGKRAGRAVVERGGEQGAHTGINPQRILHHAGGQCLLLGSWRQAAHALGPAGGARGISHVAAWPACRAGERWLCLQPDVEALGRAVASVDQNHLHSGRNRGSDLGQQIGLDEQHFGTAIGKNEAGFVALEVPVDLAVIGAGDAAALDDVDVGRVVAQHHRNNVAILDAQIRQTTGEARRARVDFGAAALQGAAYQACRHAACASRES